MNKEGLAVTVAFPSDWSPLSLGELETRGILLFRNGFSCGTHETGGRGIPHLRPFNVTEDGRISLHEIKTIPYDSGMETYALQPGDVLYNNTNSEELVGKCAYWAGREGLNVLSNHMTIMRVCDPQAIDPSFLALHLYWFWLTGSARMICRRHVNQASIGLERMRRIIIQSPTVAEQREISAVLAKIQAAVHVQDRIVATLKELKAATMAKLFREGLRGERLRQTQFGEVPEDWMAVPLDEVAHIQTGVTKGRKIEGDSATIEVPYLRVANVQDGYLDLSEIKTIQLRELELQRYSLQTDDVLLTEGGDFDKLGRGYLWGGQIPGCVHQNHIFAVRADRNKLLPGFFAYLVQSEYGKGYFLTVAHKTTNLASINSSKLKAFPVLLPSLSEQREIAATLRRIDDSIEIEVWRLKTLQTAFASVLRLLMTGQVRVPLVTGGKEAVDQTPSDRSSGDPVTSQLPEAVERFVGELVRRFEPERVVLFGQYAEGSPKAFEEVGFLVEMDFEGLAREQAARIAQEIPHDFSLDVVVRRPEEIGRAIEIGDRYLGGIVEQGRVLYVQPPDALRRTVKAAPKPAERPRRELGEETLAEIVRCIVEAVAPEQIILFGSAARGGMGPDSDVDFLVVKSCADRRETARTIYRQLRRVAPGLSKDIIVVTPEDVERDRDTIGYIIRPALREGRVVYAA